MRCHPGFLFRFLVTGDFFYVFVLKNIMIYLLSCNQNIVHISGHESIAEDVKRFLQSFAPEYFSYFKHTVFFGMHKNK
jgi:hypothetical protein